MWYLTHTNPLTHSKYIDKFYFLLKHKMLPNITTLSIYSRSNCASLINFHIKQYRSKGFPIKNSLNETLLIFTSQIPYSRLMGEQISKYILILQKAKHVLAQQRKHCVRILVCLANHALGHLGQNICRYKFHHALCHIIIP